MDPRNISFALFPIDTLITVNQIAVIAAELTMPYNAFIESMRNDRAVHMCHGLQPGNGSIGMPSLRSKILSPVTPDIVGRAMVLKFIPIQTSVACLSCLPFINKAVHLELTYVTSDIFSIFANSIGMNGNVHTISKLKNHRTFPTINVFNIRILVWE